MAQEIISRDAALAAGLKRYFTGIPCKYGHVDWRGVSNMRCSECARQKARSEYPKQQASGYFRKYYQRPGKAEHRRTRARAYHNRGRSILGSVIWRKDRLEAAASRAKKLGLLFDREAVRELLTNPPTHCPVFGIAFTPGTNTGTSPSIDRIRPELGYVRGNIALISLHANRVKNSATLAELRAVADWLDRSLSNAHSSD